MVKFVNHSTVELIDSNFSDDMVVKAARVSTKGSNSSGDLANPGLITYLMSNKHYSPFEHGSATFLIECPIFTAVQILRHRTGAYNMESGRYRELQDEFFVPEHSRTQKGKPGHYVFEVGSNELDFTMFDQFYKAYEVAYECYQNMLKVGIAREIARMVLPTGLMTSLYATFNPRTLMQFLNLRCDQEAQEEVREVADLMKTIFENLMPMTYAAWSKNGI